MNHQTGGLSPEAYMAFFETGAIPSDLRTVPPSATGGLGVVEYMPDPATPAYRQRHGKEYATEYREAEQRMLMERAKLPAPPDPPEQLLHRLNEEKHSADDGRSAVTRSTVRMSELEVDTYAETLSGMGINDRPDQQHLTRVYQSYNFSHLDPTATRLPIQAKRQEIVTAMNSFDAIVLVGRTGCGKTTQVPQYLLDEARRVGSHANIVVTQPRRIAAVSVARRVAKERNWPVGTLVGYEIGMDKKTGPDTRITYCTTGVLLQKLVHQGNMNQYTHVVLDEVHERDTDTDFALLLVRRLLRSASRGVKVILMSATFNTRLFADYFAEPLGGRLDPAPVVSCGLEQMFDVTVHYIEELAKELRKADIPASHARMELERSSDPTISPHLYRDVCNLIKMFNGFELAEFGASPRFPGFGAQRGSVLVFLPGMHEIRELSLELEPFCLQERWHILPLHSLITSDEQNAVFRTVPPDERKIILSTNIAESSITVTDVKYVVDFCLTKELEMDPETGYPKLRLSWASKANCLQRQGRAGRVSAGRVYRLITHQFFRGLPDFGVPEMLRSPLEHVVIKAKKLCPEQEPKAVLALALDPPDLEKIYAAVLHLKEVGALIDIIGAERFNMYDGDLTVLGHVMSALPVDVNVARLLALGHAYGCLRECLIIAAGLTSKTFFARPFNDELRAYRSKVFWSFGTFSDCLAVLHVYEVWQDHIRQGHFERSGGRSEKDWAEKNFLQLRCLKDMDALRQELERRLDRCNIRITGGWRANQQTLEETRQQAMVLQVCLAGAFYPNFFLRMYNENREVDASRELANRNPHTTVVVSGLPRDCSALYYGQLVRQLRFIPTDPDPVIQFDNSKAYVQFAARRRDGDRSDLDGDRNAWDGDIPAGVYMAVRMGQIRTKRPFIMRYSPEEERQKMEVYHRMQERRGITGHIVLRRPTGQPPTAVATTESPRSPDTCRLPGPGISTIAVVVTHVEDPGRFFVRYSDATGNDEYERVHEVIANLSCSCAPLTQRPELGHVYLAPFTEQGVTSHYRARVDVVAQRFCMVYFIDFGNTAEVPWTELLSFSPELVSAGVLDTNALAAECCCSELKPTQDMAGRWNQRSIDRFTQLVLYQSVRGHVYSVVHNVIHVELFRTVRQGHSTHDVSINVELKNEQLAEHALESYQSRENRRLRERPLHYGPWSGAGGDGQPPDSWERCHLSSDPELTNWLKRQEVGSRREQLRGPDSPLALTLHGLPRSLHTRPAFMDSDSCNAVLLDTEPQNPFDRVLVAFQVCPTSDGSRMRASGTTLMPNLPGLPALLVLLFAPVVELRVNSKKTWHTGAVCGLGGAGDTHQAIYPDHDMEVAFDVAITTKDVMDVNMLRASFWRLYGGADGADTVEPHRLRHSDRTVAEQQLRRRSRLLALLARKREPLLGAERVLSRTPFRWGRLSPEETLQVQLDEDADERLAPLLISGVQSVQRAEAEELRSRAEALFTLARNSEVPEPHHCPLCETTLPTPLQLLRHVNSDRHRLEVQKLFQEDDEYDDDGDDDDRSDN